MGRKPVRDDLSEWSDRVSDIMDEMLNRSFVPYRASGTWQPATNVYETPHAYVLCIELAGIATKNVHVEVSNLNRVIIRGRRSLPGPAGATQLSVHVLEIDEGFFCRDVELPEPIDVRQITTRYQQGYLWLTLPKIRS